MTHVSCIWLASQKRLLIPASASCPSDTLYLGSQGSLFLSPLTQAQNTFKLHTSRIQASLFKAIQSFYEKKSCSCYIKSFNGMFLSPKYWAYMFRLLLSQSRHQCQKLTYSSKFGLNYIKCNANINTKPNGKKSVISIFKW